MSARVAVAPSGIRRRAGRIMIERMLRHIIELIVLVVVISFALGIAAGPVRDGVAAAGEFVAGAISDLVPLFAIMSAAMLLFFGILFRASRRIQQVFDDGRPAGRSSFFQSAMLGRRRADDVPRSRLSHDVDEDDPVLPLF